jgi:hypothetical protein
MLMGSSHDLSEVVMEGWFMYFYWATVVVSGSSGMNIEIELDL